MPSAERKPCLQRHRLVVAIALTLTAAGVSGQSTYNESDRDREARTTTLDTVLVIEQVDQKRYTASASSVAGLTTTPVLEIPQSIQIITRDLIDDQGALSLAELLGNNVASASGTLARSVPFATGSTRVRGQDVAIFRDGLRDIDYSDIDTSALVNVAGVEILKGPAGLLYGSGGPGGVINIITKRPTDSLLAQGSVTMGQRDTTIASGDVSVPLGSGLGFRVTGERERSDSFINFAEIDRANYSAVFTYDKDEALALTLRYENIESRDDGAATRVGLPVAGTITQRDRLRIGRSTYLGEPALDYQRSFGDILFGEAKYRFTDNLSLTAAARRSTVNFEQTEVRTLGALNLDTRLVARTRARQLDLEEEQKNARVFLGADFQTGAITHDLVVGLEYFEFDLLVENRAIANANIPRINVLAPQYLPPGTVVPLGPPAVFNNLDKAREVFVQDVARLGDLTITGALRRNRSDFQSSFDDPARLTQTLYQLGGTYALNKDLSVFAGHSTGFNANSDIATALSQNQERFDPEFYRQTEIGVKTSLLADLTGTASIFEIRRDDILVADPADPDFLLQVGQERTRGFEADLVWTPTSSFQLRGGYAYLDAIVTRDTNPDRIGNRRALVPRQQFNAYGAYTFREGWADGLQFGLGATHSTRAFASVTNTVEQPAFTVVNLTASYSFDRYRIDAFVTNALDEHYFIARDNTRVNPGEPRLASLRFTARF